MTTRRTWSISPTWQRWCNWWATSPRASGRSGVSRRRQPYDIAASGLAEPALEVSPLAAQQFLGGHQLQRQLAGRTIGREPLATRQAVLETSDGQADPFGPDRGP